jgi:hypothetical protein
MPGQGKPFKKGERPVGRAPGTPNVVTRQIREMVTKALDKAGGVSYLVKQAEKNPVAFMTLVGKAMPLQVAGPSGQPASPRRLIVELVDESPS